MNNKKTLAAIATMALGAKAACLNPTPNIYGIEDQGHPTTDLNLLQDGANSWLFPESSVGAVLACTDNASGKLAGLQMGISRPMQELPFDTEPIPEVDVHRWWLSSYGNTNVDDTTTCDVFYVGRGDFINFIRIDGNIADGISRFEVRTTGAENNLFVAGTAPEGSSWFEQSYMQDIKQFVGLYGNSQSTFIPAIGFISMEPTSCTFASNEEKANELKEDWTKPAYVLAIETIIEPIEVVEDPGLSAGMIAGIVCGATAVLAAVILTVTFCCRKRQRDNITPKFTINDLEAGDHGERVESHPHEWEQTVGEQALCEQIDELKEAKGKRARSLLPQDSAQKLEYPTDSEYKREPRGTSLVS